MPNTRPEILDGSIKKVKVGCGALFITVGFNQGKIYEIFLNGSKLGGCRANQESIGRILSLAFRYEIPTAEIIDQLALISCPACTRAKAKLNDSEQIKNAPTSCGDAVAKVLKQLLDNKGD
jgi:hypothetical protein